MRRIFHIVTTNKMRIFYIVATNKMRLSYILTTSKSGDLELGHPLDLIVVFTKHLMRSKKVLAD